MVKYGTPHNPKLALPATECIVSGLLAYLLRLSRIAGVAPLSFKKVHDGWSIRLSQAAHVYGVIFGILISALSIGAVFIDLFLDGENSLRLPTNSTRVVWIAEVLIVGSVVCTAAYTGLQRMNCLLQYLVELQKIRSKLNISINEPVNERTNMIVVVILMSILFINIVTDIVVYTRQALRDDGNLITTNLYVFSNISNVILEIILLQFTQIARSVLAALQTLNKCLKKLLEEIVTNTAASSTYMQVINDNQLNLYHRPSRENINNVIDTMATYISSFKTPQKQLPSSVNRFSMVYCSICEVVYQVNASFGAVLVTLMLALLLHLVITPYHTITSLVNRSQSSRSNLFLQTNWAIVHCSNVLLIVEPCHRTHEEMDITKHLISQMMRFTSEHEELYSELKMFYRHVMMNDVYYSPLQMFTVDRAMIVGILGSITTYLVVIIQL